MPKSLTVGNGNILVCMDDHAQVRDFFFPYVGLENHLGGHLKHRVGAYSEGDLRWFDDDSWSISVNCKTSSLAGDVSAYNDKLGVSIHLHDAVYNERNIFLRKCTIKNTADREREIKIFFHQQFELYESHTAHTAFFDPYEDAIIHYRGKRVFLIDAAHSGEPFDEYTTGVSGIDGKEGSHKDAEDGALEKNPIDHGPADSVIGLTVNFQPKEEKVVHYWVAVGKSLDEVKQLNRYIDRKGPEHLLQTTDDFWYAWTHRRNFKFETLNDSVVSQFKKSLLMMRSHVDTNGAIIASGDSDMLQQGKDTYGYMWPRDGAFSAIALDKVGDSHVTRSFFEFCNEVIEDEGYFMHKYGADKALGSSWHPWIYNGEPQLPIQEDETALVVYALWQHYIRSKDIDFVEKLYNPLIKRAANFLVSFRDGETGLPHESYDLWEEKRGIHTFTCAAVYGALMAAANFADLLGKAKSSKTYRDAAQEIREATLEHMYSEEKDVFIKGIYRQNGEIRKDMTVDMSSVYGMYAFDMLAIDDERIEKSIQTIEDVLVCDTSVSGVARYEDDNYYHSSYDVPGNPWFITTLWLAKYYIKKAETEEEILDAQQWLHWADTYSLGSGILSEQLDPHTGKQISAAPLTWSHAEFVTAVTDYLSKLEELGLCNVCNPIK